MKKTVSAHVYNTIERYPQILKTPKVEKAMGNFKCWMALRVNRGFDNSSGMDVESQQITEAHGRSTSSLVGLHGGVEDEPTTCWPSGKGLASLESRWGAQGAERWLRW